MELTENRSDCVGPPWFAPGDTVRIKPHITGPQLYPDIRYQHPKAGLEFVVELNIPPSFKYDSPNKCSLRRLKEDGSDVYTENVHGKHLELVTKGPGFYTAGASVPFSKRELANQRLEAFRQKFIDTPVPEHEGFINAATFLAWLYLNNDRGFRNIVRSMWRKDGSVNPNKIKKAFQDRKLVMDDWAMQPHIEVPPEYNRHWLPGRDRLHVRWQEVADMFHRNIEGAT